METAPTCHTPHIDDLAGNGILFTSFYSGAAVCSPSRASLLTGRNKTRLGIYNWIPPNVPMHLESEEETIAEMLKPNNYVTAHFGKWHLTSANRPQPEPLDQGFDYAFWTHNNAKPSHKNPVNFIRNREALGEKKGYSSHLIVDVAISWLNKNAKDETPFYINIWFHEPHSKQAAPDSLKNRHNRYQACYGCIENMDYAVGKLMNFLKEKNLDENTLIMYTSDNGSNIEGSNYPLRGEKCYQYEGGIRIPFIAYWKERIPAGTKSHIVGHFTDVLPTIASISRSQLPAGRNIDGEDLSAVFLGKTKDYQRKEPIFFYRYFHDPICMLRKDSLILFGYQEKPKAWQARYDEYADALFKPEKNAPKWSQWGFQESHMQAILLQEPNYFELYDIETDLAQHIDISKDYPELTEYMKQMMLGKRREMVSEGGNWFQNK